MVRKIDQLFKIFKILIVSSFWLIVDDVTVTLSLVVVSGIFFSNSPLYYLTPYQNLLRLNVIFMVIKIGKEKVHGGRGGMSDLKNFFMDRRPKDEPTAKTLVCKKLFPFPRKIGKTCWGWHPPPWPSEG